MTPSSDYNWASGRNGATREQAGCGHIPSDCLATASLRLEHLRRPQASADFAPAPARVPTAAVSSGRWLCYVVRGPDCVASVQSVEQGPVSCSRPANSDLQVSACSTCAAQRETQTETYRRILQAARASTCGTRRLDREFDACIRRRADDRRTCPVFVTGFSAGSSRCHRAQLRSSAAWRSCLRTLTRPRSRCPSCLASR